MRGNKYIRWVRVNRGAQAKRQTFGAVITQRLSGAVRLYGARIQNFIRMSMRAPKHGKVSIVKGKRHVSSAPGEAPAIRSGGLYRAILPSYSADGFRVSFAPKPFYGRFLESGTRKMEPRPHLQPAFDVFREAFRKDVRAIIQGAISA